MQNRASLKVLVVSTEYPPLGAGASNALWELTRQWDTLPDLDVEVIAGSAGAEEERLMPGGTRLRLLDHGKRGGNLHHQSLSDLLRLSWEMHKAVRERIQEKQFDLVHAFFAVPTGAIVRLALRGSAIPYSVGLRGSDVPGYHPGYDWLQPMGLRALVRNVIQKAEGVTANSESLAELMRETDPKTKTQIHLIPNGVDQERYTPRAKRPSQQTVLMVGRLTERKGQRLLLEAVSQMEKKPDIRLVGDGPDRAHLEEMVREKGLQDIISLYGLQTKEEVLGHYHASSILCQLSHHEGMSNSVLEALSCGLRVITTDTGGARELKRVTERVKIVNPHPEEISQALTRELLSLEQAKGSPLPQEYAWESRAREYEAWWRKVAFSRKH